SVQYGHDVVVVLAPHENVEVLRIAADPRVVLERVGTPDEKCRVSLLQRVQHAEIESARTLVQFYRRWVRITGHAYCSDSGPLPRVEGSKQCAWRPSATCM